MKYEYSENVLVQDSAVALMRSQGDRHCEEIPPNGSWFFRFYNSRHPERHAGQDL